MKFQGQLVAIVCVVFSVPLLFAGATSAQSVLTDTHWPAVHANPNGYKKDRVDITGQIMTTPIYQAPLTQYEIYVDPQNYGESTLVVIKGKPNFTNGAYIEVTGYLYGSVSGKNELNGTVTLPAVIATSIKRIDRTQAVAPTIDVSSATQYIHQNKVVVRVAKVEYAKTETRVFIDAINNSGANITFNNYEATLVQGSHQMQQKNIFSNPYPQFPSPMASGVKAQEVLVFDAANLRGGKLKLDISLSSDNYNQAFKDYVFVISSPHVFTQK